MDTNIAEQLLLENQDYKNAEHLVDVEGMSSARICRFLNDLVAHMDAGESYLEIGTWKGRTLLSAAYGNHGRICVACDKFRFYGPYTKWGFQAKRAFYANLDRYRAELAEIQFHHMNQRTLFRRRLVPSPVGVYFYDGDHSYAGTRYGILAAAPLLSPRAVILVDDWTNRGVGKAIRRATTDALAAAGLKTLWSRTLEGAHADWWNGLGVFYVERGE